MPGNQQYSNTQNPNQNKYRDALNPMNNSTMDVSTGYGNIDRSIGGSILSNSDFPNNFPNNLPGNQDLYPYVSKQQQQIDGIKYQLENTQKDLRKKFPVGTTQQQKDQASTQQQNQGDNIFGNNSEYDQNGYSNDNDSFVKRINKKNLNIDQSASNSLGGGVMDDLLNNNNNSSTGVTQGNNLTGNKRPGQQQGPQQRRSKRLKKNELFNYKLFNQTGRKQTGRKQTNQNGQYPLKQEDAIVYYDQNQNQDI